MCPPLKRNVGILTSRKNLSIWPYLEIGPPYFFFLNWDEQEPPHPRDKVKSLVWALIWYDWCPYNKGKCGQRYTQRECRMNMKAEWSDRSTSQGISRIASKPPANRGEAWNRFSPRTLQRNQSCPHPDLGLLSSRTMRQKISVILKPSSLWYFIMAVLANQHTYLSRFGGSMIKSTGSRVRWNCLEGRYANHYTTTTCSELFESTYPTN